MFCTTNNILKVMYNISNICLNVKINANINSTVETKILFATSYFLLRALFRHILTNDIPHYVF